MKQKTLSPKAFLFASFFMAGALTLEQIFIYLRFYDFDAGLWLHNTPGIVKGLVYITLALIILFAGAYLFSSKIISGHGDTIDAESTPLRVSALFCVASLIATIIVQLAAIGSFDHLYLLLISGSSDYTAIASYLHRFTLILAPFACLWFVWLLRGKKPTVAIGILPIVYFMILALRIYFDMTTLLTDPRWGFRVITLVFVMLFMLAEVNLLVHKKRSLLHCLMAVPALCVITASSLSSLIFNVSGHFSDGIEVAYFVLELAFASYIAVRLIAVTKEPEKPDSAKEIVLVDRSEVEQEDDRPEDTLPEEAPVASFEEKVEEEEELDDLTEDEVRRFYKAVTLSVRKRMVLSNPPTAEEEAAVKEESLAIIVAVLRTEDRNGRISAVRTFLEKSERANSPTQPTEENA